MASTSKNKNIDPVWKLKSQWKKHRIIIMNSTFESMTHEWYSLLFDQAKKMDEPLLTEENVGESQRVHQKLHDDPKIQPSNASKKLFG